MIPHPHPHPQPPSRIPTHLPEHVEEPSALSSLGGHICSWAFWDPSPGSLWGAISGCPTENPVTGRRMGPSKHPVERGDQRQALLPPPPSPPEGPFPTCSRGRVPSQQGQGLARLPAVWPGVSLSPLVLSKAVEGRIQWI